MRPPGISAMLPGVLGALALLPTSKAFVGSGPTRRTFALGPCGWRRHGIMESKPMHSTLAPMYNSRLLQPGRLSAVEGRGQEEEQGPESTPQQVAGGIEDEDEDPYLGAFLAHEPEDAEDEEDTEGLEPGTEVRRVKSWHGESKYLFREESVEMWRKLGTENKGPRPYFKELASMAEAAANMPMDFLNYPDVAYYKIGGDLKTCRLITGTWQLDGQHGYHPFFQDVKRDIREMVGVDGYTTFDVAPFYGHAERWIGEVRSHIEDPVQLNAYKLFSKYSPPMRLDKFNRGMIEQMVDESLKRMKLDRLDLLQLHWWDFEDERYLDALQYMTELVDKGKLRYIGVTNWDAKHLRIALDTGFPIVTNQVQYSLIDQRPSRELTSLCQERNVTLLCYGTLLGGFLTDRYLGMHEPDANVFQSTSEEKYYEMLRAWGTWEQFQDLLQELKVVARKHRSKIAHVAMRWVMDRPAVGSVIVGTRLGMIEHLQDNKEVLKLKLTDQDRENLARAASAGRSLFDIIGDVGAEYRRVVRSDWASDSDVAQGRNKAKQGGTE